MNRGDNVATIGAVEPALTDRGNDFDVGAGLAAAPAAVDSQATRTTAPLILNEAGSGLPGSVNDTRQ